MKKIIVGLAIMLSSLFSIAQSTRDHSEALKSISLNVSAITLGMIGDGLLDEGRDISNQNMMAWGHTLRGSSIAVMLSNLYFKKI